MGSDTSRGLDNPWSDLGIDTINTNPCFPETAMKQLFFDIVYPDIYTHWKWIQRAALLQMEYHFRVMSHFHTEHSMKAV